MVLLRTVAVAALPVTVVDTRSAPSDNRFLFPSFTESFVFLRTMFCTLLFGNSFGCCCLFRSASATVIFRDFCCSNRFACIHLMFSICRRGSCWRALIALMKTSRSDVSDAPRSSDSISLRLRRKYLRTYGGSSA